MHASSALGHPILLRSRLSVAPFDYQLGHHKPEIVGRVRYVFKRVEMEEPREHQLSGGHFDGDGDRCGSNLAYTRRKLNVGFGLVR